MNGATFLYEHHLKRLLKENQGLIDDSIHKAQAKIDQLKKEAVDVGKGKFSEMTAQVTNQVVQQVSASLTGGAKKEQ